MISHLVRQLAAFALAAAALFAAEPAAKPNVVIILMDDMGYGDISPFNPQCKNRTPNLTRMAKEGLRLTSFYAAPVCTPSRAQLLTGCYAKRVSLPAVIFPMSNLGINPEEHTIAALMHEQGYATMCIGKWHVGDQPEFLPTKRGFDHYFGIPYSNDMGGADSDKPLPAGKAHKPPLPLLRDGEVIETLNAEGQDHITQRYTDEAVKFIREHKSGPFFLYLPHTAVHVPLHPGPDFKGKSANGNYGDWVEEADASTGRILDTLRELKLEQNTLVVFTSDNGPWLVQGAQGGNAGPLRGGKGGTFEGGMREPTIAWWPGHIAPGAASDAVGGLIDLLPTCVEVAGGTVPTDRKIDGLSLAPLLLGKTQDSPHQAYFYFSGPALQAIRSGTWKLAIKPQRENTGKDEDADSKEQKGEAFLPRLYDLAKDIGETTDVAAQHPDVVKRLQELVAPMAADLGDHGAAGPGVRPPAKSDAPLPLLLKK